MSRELHVLDSCVLLNLLATGQAERLLGSLSNACDFMAAEPVFAEIRCLDTAPDAEGARRKEPISLRPLVDSGEVALVSVGEIPVEAFVRCAETLTDCDAACVALAGVRGAALVTDDLKARRVAQGLFPRVALVSTLGLLRRSTTALGLPDSELRGLAFNLRWRGNFLPPRSDPARSWYDELLRI